MGRCWPESAGRRGGAAHHVVQVDDTRVLELARDVQLAVRPGPSNHRAQHVSTATQHSRAWRPRIDSRGHTPDQLRLLRSVPLDVQPVDHLPAAQNTIAAAARQAPMRGSVHRRLIRNEQHPCFMCSAGGGTETGRPAEHPRTPAPLHRGCPPAALPRTFIATGRAVPDTTPR